MNEDYLGDGVYIKFDGYQMILMANDHRNPTDTIAIDPAVFKRLLGYAERIGLK